MQTMSYGVLLALIIMITCVLVRNIQLKKLGITAIHFGKKDKKDFLIPPFILFYFYLIIAQIFNLPRFNLNFSYNPLVAGVGLALCFIAPMLFIWGVVSFGKSFRVGLDDESPSGLITGGAFGFSRNPLYLAFFSFLLGSFLTFQHWLFLAYFVAGLWLIDRQVNLEENSLRKIYGKEYEEYCGKVRRYL